MRGAFGKPTGTVARVDIGQIIFSVRTKEAFQPHIIEGLRRAKYKFPGRQTIMVSRKWGFTKYTKAEYEKLRADDRVVPDGAYCKVKSNHGPLGSALSATSDLTYVEA
jgi:large subunit ribosomal protein L10e